MKATNLKIAELQTRMKSMQEGVHFLNTNLPIEVQALNIDLINLSNNMAYIQMIVEQLYQCKTEPINLQVAELSEIAPKEEIVSFIEDMFGEWLRTCNETGVDVSDKYQIIRIISEIVKCVL